MPAFPPLALAALMLAALPAAAVPAAAQQAAPSQLAASVGLRLRAYGFDVDPRTLSTRQLAALHMLMSDHENGFHSRVYTQTRQQIRTILSWDAPTVPEPAQ